MLLVGAVSLMGADFVTNEVQSREREVLTSTTALVGFYYLQHGALPPDGPLTEDTPWLKTLEDPEAGGGGALCAHAQTAKLSHHGTTASLACPDGVTVSVDVAQGGQPKVSFTRTDVSYAWRPDERVIANSDAYALYPCGGRGGEAAAFPGLPAPGSANAELNAQLATFAHYATYYAQCVGHSAIEHEAQPDGSAPDARSTDFNDLILLLTSSGAASFTAKELHRDDLASKYLQQAQDALKRAIPLAISDAEKQRLEQTRSDLAVLLGADSLSI